MQEAVSNIIKYADAIAAKVILTENKDTVVLEIMDNGKGFNVKETLGKKGCFWLTQYDRKKQSNWWTSSYHMH